MREPKFTVVIPTRERCDVLGAAIRTVIQQDYDNLEILVSDNFSKDLTRDVVNGFSDPRIRYLNTGERLSMARNWEFALGNVTAPSWVTILGDDDGLLPGALNMIAGIASTHDVQAIRTATCSYRWPSLTGQAVGKLVVPIKAGLEMRSSSEWLSKVICGRASYFELPMLYNGGFVESTLINELKSKTGCFYRSCIPDVYSSIALSKLTSNYVYSHRASAINGASMHSTGTSQFQRNADDAELGDSTDLTTPAQKFESEKNIPFHSDIPLTTTGAYPKSIQAMIYESHLQSLDLGGNLPGANHTRQLAIILKKSAKDSVTVEEWGRLFASKHSLDFDDIKRSSNSADIYADSVSFLRALAEELYLYELGSVSLPIKDVYEASVAAAVTLELAPGYLQRISQNILKRLKRHAVGHLGNSVHGADVER